MVCNIMYIYFLLFQDTGGRDDCDCKMKDDLMNFVFLTSLCATCLTSSIRAQPMQDEARLSDLL